MSHQPKPYPDTAKVEQVDDYHGTKIDDPYRWLEDLDAPDTAAWVEAQNEVTFDYLGGIGERDRIHARMTELWDFEKFGVPFKEGGRYFLTQNDGLRNQFVLQTADDPAGEWDVLIDPNTWSADGTVALNDAQPSKVGDLLAYAVAEAGSDWMQWKVLDLTTRKDRPDIIKDVKFSTVAWLPDGSGFYYGRYDRQDDLEARNEFQKLTFHAIGTSQDDDVLVYERPDRGDIGFAPQVTEDGRYLIIGMWVGTDPKTGVLVKDLTADEPIVELLTGFDAKYSVVGNDGPVLFVHTDLDAPLGKLIAIDLRDPARDNWKTLIPEGDAAVTAVSLVGNRFVVQALRDARSEVEIHEIDGSFVREVALPGPGTVLGFGGKRDDPETFFWYTGYTTPPVIYRLDVATGESGLLRKPNAAFDPDEYQTDQVFLTSKDGTRVPMFISHKKGIVRDGTNPTYLYGYGGFSIPLTPTFSVSALAWMEMGGIYAVANLRGGGEYGEEWHEAGTKERKQNVFDDFIAAAEYLIDRKYTVRSKLAIGGGSNGGLLVGACITQRPELFGGAILAVGVLDMLRYHKFTIGWAWVSDYGSPDDPEMFPHLLAYSPLHNLRDGVRYPATLVTTADHDDRVVPSHSFKFISQLQAVQAGDAPVLIRVDVRAGHGMGKPTSKVVQEWADCWAFLRHVLGVSAG